ncbi:hypothetical protein HDU93_002242 [Gonapodya sp. JEL0774]|nr:hypothetical protein HDU93_002242 [Gonapodya sp. JEL0774]
MTIKKTNVNKSKSLPPRLRIPSTYNGPRTRSAAKVISLPSPPPTPKLETGSKSQAKPKTPKKSGISENSDGSSYAPLEESDPEPLVEIFVTSDDSVFELAKTVETFAGSKPQWLDLHMCVAEKHSLELAKRRRSTHDILAPNHFTGNVH